MQNARAFASCIAAAFLAACACTASAGTIKAGAILIDTVTVGNPGNTGKAITGGTFGGVSQEYQIGKYEVTNNQYTAFLNSVAASDPYSLYSTNMNGNATGGISRFGSSGSFTYSVKSPTAGDQPVNWVSVYSAARFVNWLNNGSPTIVASGSVNSVINAGAYTLANLTNPGTALTRNPDASVFLPNRDEWYKAAYYSQTLNSGTGGYYTYASASNTAPTVSTNPAAAGTNLGYYGQSNLSIPMVADGLASTQSPYGVVGMLGNTSEWLENSTATQAYWIGGWYNMPSGNLNTWNANTFAGAPQSSMNMSGAQGLRVAAVAVPEPSTIVMAGLGLAALAGGRMASRRRAHRLALALEV